ncbi:MAG: PHP domain-containing protein, partial [Anaerolineales bacterium]
MKFNIDLHCHTNQSSDSLMTISQIIKKIEKSPLQKIAITDHNSIQAALQAVQVAPHLFIIGEEIMTRQGEILAYFVQEEIPAGLDAIEVIKELR